MLQSHEEKVVISHSMTKIILTVCLGNGCFKDGNEALAVSCCLQSIKMVINQWQIHTVYIHRNSH